MSSIDAAKSVLAEILEIETSELTDEDTIESVERWDSLNHMRMIMLLEEKHKTTVATDDAMEMFTLQAIASWIEKQT
ncbi:hypothetical protein GUA87_13710 [Sneathiella sp. P13V-1]|uniref:acyl carrier protein n=1 Tax=Sneathiella sp. P13V-1 TaxID=2697366 RepID=UPI00187B41E8|nr:acyl carrier protein [Sneathiella sp. P13V-1]MBE7637908.1 hypothetical protein [Sneathiella sp. P13V-1]